MSPRFYPQRWRIFFLPYIVLYGHTRGVENGHLSVILTTGMPNWLSMSFLYADDVSGLLSQPWTSSILMISEIARICIRVWFPITIDVIFFASFLASVSSRVFTRQLPS